MLYSAMNENSTCYNISLVSDLDLETEEEDKKEDTKKEKEEYKYISRYSIQFVSNANTGNSYVLAYKFHLNPSRTTSTPPPDFI